MNNTTLPTTFARCYIILLLILLHVLYTLNDWCGGEEI